jgi:hypothetical protein
MEGRPRPDALVLFANRSTQTDEGKAGMTIVIDSPWDHEAGKVCTPVRLSLRRTFSMSLLPTPDGDEDDGSQYSEKDRLDIERQNAAQLTFVRFMFPTLRSAMSSCGIRLVVELLPTDNVLSEFVGNDRNLSYASAADTNGAAAIVNHCADGNVCIALILTRRSVEEIEEVIDRVTNRVRVRMLLVVIDHAKGCLPAHAIPLRLHRDDCPMQTQTRQTEVLDWDVSAMMVSLSFDSYRATINAISKARATPPTRRMSSCPTLVVSSTS